MHKVHHWSLMYNKVNKIRGKRPYMVKYSNRKQRPQKGSGRARMGSLKACGRIKGGKAFAPIPKIYRYHLNTKIKLKGLCAALSGKLAEGKIVVLNNDDITLERNMKNKIVPIRGEKEMFLFVHPKQSNLKLVKAMKNMNYFKSVNPNTINMIDLLKFDKLVFTEQSLKEFQILMLAYTFFVLKPKVIENEFVEQVLNLNYDTNQPDAKYTKYDPEIGFEPSFNLLKDYYQKYTQYRD